MYGNNTHISKKTIFNFFVFFTIVWNHLFGIFGAEHKQVSLCSIV